MHGRGVVGKCSNFGMITAYLDNGILLRLTRVCNNIGSIATTIARMAAIFSSFAATVPSCDYAEALWCSSKVVVTGSIAGNGPCRSTVVALHREAEAWQVRAHAAWYIT